VGHLSEKQEKSRKVVPRAEQLDLCGKRFNIALGSVLVLGDRTRRQDYPWASELNCLPEDLAEEGPMALFDER
jgi:hypothetical protein